MILYQPKNGYCYNSDTHFLYSFICKNLKKFKNIKGDILDIGSGSGILGLLLARDYSNLSLYQCEIQNEFQFLTQKNSQLSKIEHFLYKGSFLEISFDKKFDFCISNPPFYHQAVLKSENRNIKIARYNDSMPLEKFLEKSSRVLKENGKLFFCYDSKQVSKILFFLRKYKFNLEAMQFVHPKISKDATLVLIYLRKNSKSLTKILKPLIVFDEDNNFNQEVQEIYKRSETYSIKVELD